MLKIAYVGTSPDSPDHQDKSPHSQELERKAPATLYNIRSIDQKDHHGGSKCSVHHSRHAYNENRFQEGLPGEPISSFAVIASLKASGDGTVSTERYPAWG